VNRTLKRTAEELTPELDRLITQAIEVGDPEDIDRLTGFFWDNKVGILRVLQAVAAE